MIAGVKKCMDEGDITGLRYIFLDSLDVDPTFEKYKEDYEVCRHLDGMFEPYIELTPLSLLRSDWNMDYWVKIKFDQKKNFSEKRFGHIIEVAKVVNAEKVERLLAERKKSVLVPPKRQSPMPDCNEVSEDSSSAVNRETIEETRRNIERINQRANQEKDEQERRIMAHKGELENENRGALAESQSHSKKGLGIVVIIAVIVAIVVVVLWLKVL